MTSSPMNHSTIVALGDSITHGHQTPKPQIWTVLLDAQLQQALGNKTHDKADDKTVKVINAGVGGNTSAEGLARFDKDVLPHLPALVLVEFGGNDTNTDPARHVAVDAFEANLRLIHQKVTAKQGRVVFLSFPPVINDWHPRGHDPMCKEAGGLDQYIQPYRDKTRQIAQSLDCPFFDLDKLLRDATAKQGQERFAMPDGIHLTVEAHQLVANALTTFLADKL